MKKKPKLENTKDQTFNPFNLFLMIAIILGFLYLSDINTKNTGKDKGLRSSLEKFVIERVALF